jgi:signal transduction histidine kinase
MSELGSKTLTKSARMREVGLRSIEGHVPPVLYNSLRTFIATFTHLLEEEDNPERLERQTEFLFQEFSLALMHLIEIKATEEARQLLAQSLKHARHEITTPITAVRLKFDMIRMMLEAGKPLEQVLLAIFTAKKHLTLIKETVALQLRDPEAGPIPLEPVNLQTIIEEEFLPLANDFLKEYGIKHPQKEPTVFEVKVSLNPKLPEPKIMANPVEFINILRNLLDNALNHGQAEEVKIYLTCTDAKVVIFFTNKGQPIPLGIIQQIFDEGFKGPNSNGTGHGLSWVKAKIQEWGGSIRHSRKSTRKQDSTGHDLQSDSQNGLTTFTMELPLVIEAAEEEKGTAEFGEKEMAVIDQIVADIDAQEQEKNSGGGSTTTRGEWYIPS